MKAATYTACVDGAGAIVYAPSGEQFRVCPKGLWSPLDDGITDNEEQLPIQVCEWAHSLLDLGYSETVYSFKTGIPE